MTSLMETWRTRLDDPHPLSVENAEPKEPQLRQPSSSPRPSGSQSGFATSILTAEATRTTEKIVPRPQNQLARILPSNGERHPRITQVSCPGHRSRCDRFGNVYDPPKRISMVHSGFSWLPPRLMIR